MKIAVITKTQLLQYGALAMPVAFAGFPLYVLAPDYYATHYGLTLSLLGFILLALRIFDAVQDPLIGFLSDRFYRLSNWFMPLAAIILCAAIYGLFNHVFSSPAVWFALCMALAVGAYSVLSINLNALGAVWTTDADSQTRIAAWREAFGLLGLLIAVSAPALLARLISKDQAFFWFSILLVLLMVPALLAFNLWFTKHKRQAVRPGATKFSLRQILRDIAPVTKKLFGIYFISMLAASMPAVLVLFFIRDLLGAEEYTGLFLLLYFLSGAIGMPVWQRLSNVYGKHQAWLISMLLAIASFILAFFLNAGDGWQYGIICILSGLALGADLTLPAAILADQLHKQGQQQNAATYYSLLALLAKAGLAIASVSMLTLLDYAGFIPAQANTPFALLALSLAYAVLPCLLKLIAGLFLYQNFTHPRSIT